MKSKDITGEKFGKLTALEYTKTENRRQIWKFQCECGIIKEILKSSVTRGASKSCGCSQRKYIKQKTLKENLVGNRYGRLLVREKLSYIKGKGNKWLCSCDCGETKETFSNNLKSGKLNSCGCLRIETTRKTAGFEKDRLKAAFKNKYSSVKTRNKKLKDRYNRKNDQFISFQEFYDLVSDECFYCGKKESCVSIAKDGTVIKKNTIDRIDNKKTYTIENCVTACMSCNSQRGSKTSFKDFMKQIKLIKEGLEVIIR